MKTGKCMPLASLKLRPIQAVSLLRPLPGSSRPFLVEADDSFLYIVKTWGNLRHPNALANECLGSAMCASIGLPIATSRTIYLSAGFLRAFNVYGPYEGYTHHPLPGLHYASRMVEPRADEAFTIEYLDRKLVPFVKNRSDFLAMYLLDVCVKHRDARHAIFVKKKWSRESSAVFIDHGHMFGGSNWDLQSPLRNPYHVQIALYDGLLTSNQVQCCVKAFGAILPYAIDFAVKQLPAEWYTGDLTSLQSWLHQRVASLPQVIGEDLERAMIFRERVDASMHLQGPRVCEIGT